ncbi:MAG: NAD(P)-dependent oxidoreductase [Nitrospinae bacterium]|nr:NAD(P)-dependent oxidoreductase [Nitrospinota bacterium]
MNTRETIGFIGLGLMGRAFSRNLIEDGYRLVGADPVAAAREAFEDMGGLALASPKEVAEAADIVFISVPNSKISLECARGEDGYLTADPDKKPKAVVDTTTSDPEDTREMARLCAERGFDFMEACVSGNSENVKNRSGLFLVGGEEQTHALVKDIFARLLSDQIHCGAAGDGATMKVLINYLTCLQRCAIAESLRMGLRAGVKGELLLDAFMRSAADSRQLRNRGPRMISGDFTNPVSTLDVLTKDIKLGLALGQSVDANMPLGDLCLPFYTQGQELGFGSLDSAAVYKVFEAREGR